MVEAKMKLYSVEYLGYTAMDKRFSRPMLPWIIAEIKRRGSTEKVCLGVHDGTIVAFNFNATQPDTPMFEHSLQSVTRFSHAYNDQSSFMYLLRDTSESLLYCYLYQATDPSDVSELFNTMRDQTKEGSVGPPGANGRSLSNAANLTSLCADISPSSSHFFEVLYIGKIKVSHKKVPDSFIDDALEKFRLHELEKGKGKTFKASNSSTAIATSSNGNSSIIQGASNSVVIAVCRDDQSRRGSQDSGCTSEVLSPDPGCTSELGSSENIATTPTVMSPTALVPSINQTVLGIIPSSHQTVLGEPVVSLAGPDVLPETPAPQNGALRAQTPTGDTGWPKQPSIPLEPMRNRAASTGSAKELKKIENTDHNRTMLFLVGRTDLRLISPDRKQILLHKHLKDVASCIQGIKHGDHFGFICREPNVECFIGYVFKCQSESFADDVVGAITQAFMATSEAQRREKQPVFSCEHCPMVWYHKLCAEVEGLNDRRTQATIYRRLELLPEEETSVIVTKFHGAETSNLREQNEFLMMLLRAHCESKQARHVHDTAENRHEFLNQYLGGSTIFKMAKRSLTSSFDQLLKRKGSRDDFGPIVKELSLPMNAALCKDATTVVSSPTPAPNPEPPDSSDEGVESVKARSMTLCSSGGEALKQELQSINGGNTATTNGSDMSPASSQQQLSLPVQPITGLQTPPKGTPMMNIFLKVGNSPKTPTAEPNQDIARQTGSWRQAIFNRVVTPNKNALTDGAGGLGNGKQPLVKKDKAELRALWKKAINQQLLLIRMEKENAKLRVRQEEATVKRIKLEYDEINSCLREVMEVWDLLVSKQSRISTKCDSQMLLQAIRQGVPRSKRGDVWLFLAEQFCLKQPPIDATNFPNYHVPYENLLRQLTSHQHGILIDLGRTFPNHTYFSSPLGPGQLALFNLLKAYSLLDPEVGYCQGLSFIAGVLLLHMSEDMAFFLLRHLMFRRGLRRQYLPDMVALQVQLYQLSRLLHDQYPDLYAHFDTHEVAPTLYAAPWILTLFASQFQLGFVARVFDLLFLESAEVVFRVALALLGEHKDGLLNCDSFEEIMEYLKIKVPTIDRPILDRVMKQVFTMDISKQLHEYEVEYHVLQEEMSAPRQDSEQVKKLEQANRVLAQHNQTLMEQLQIAGSNIVRLNTTRTTQQSAINKLDSQVRSLEVSVAAMGNFISELAERRSDVELPGEVRRIVAQLGVPDRRRSSVKPHPLRVIDTQPAPYPLKSALSSPNLTMKLSGMSSFFHNSHSHIKQQRMNAANLAETAKREANGTAPKPVIPEKSNNNMEKSSSMPVSGPRARLTSSQSSFELTTRTTESVTIPAANQIHPLDTCAEVSFKFGGTTKLKTLRPLKANLGRADSISKAGPPVVEEANSAPSSPLTETPALASVGQSKPTLLTR